MNNIMTIKKEVLYLGGKINNIVAKDGSVIEYVSVSLIVKEDNCKIDTSFKVKAEEFLKMDLIPYNSYTATMQLDFSDKIKVKVIEIA